MCATFPGSMPLRLSDFFTRWTVGLFIALSLMMAGLAAYAAPPPANTVISNQASATYSDASGGSYSVASNVVLTTVQQIASLTLTANGAQSANPGSVVNYPHTLTNTGNGPDTFNLTASNTAGAFTMTGVQIYADNGSGVPTGSPITSTGSLAAGSSFKFILQGTVPAAAIAGQTNDVTVTATSVLDGTKTQSNTDRTTVTGGAVVTLLKSASVSSGPTGTAITYTLKYSNTGNAVANNVAITDVLPAGLNYVPGTARWNTTTTLSDTATPTSAGTAPNTLTSSYTPGTRTLLVTLNQITPTQTGEISFGVTVDAAAAIGTSTTTNTATLAFMDGATPVTVTASAAFNVLQSASVTLTPPAAVASAAAGSTVSFTNTLKNTGNGSDTFNITVGANNFPAGTTFQLYKSDGVTPLGGNTGPVAANATYDVILKATLPPGATNTNAPFSVAKTATSAFDPTKSAIATDVLTAISTASVDATNGAGLGVGVNPSGETTPVVTNTLNPGASTTFKIVANNTGLSPDSYNLGASTLGDFSGALPAGWTVSFRADGGAGNCSTTGATITNTGSVAANGNTVVCAVVGVPAGYAAGTTQLYFRTLSPTSGASDVLHDAVTVNAVRSIAIAPPSLSGQVAPGGSAVYIHTVTNTGNVTEGGAFSTVTLTNSNTLSASGWTTTLYYDTNGNGTLDAADLPVSGSLTSLAPGASITIINKVVAPSGAAIGLVNVTTITATTANGSYVTAIPAQVTATDNTAVVAGNLTLTKAQALDAGCTGATGGTVYAAAALSARPNQCVLYQITVTNQGTANATSVVVSDAVPDYTTLSSVAATTAGTMTANPVVGAPAQSSISAAVGTLASGQSAVVTFGVRINP